MLWRYWLKTLMLPPAGNLLGLLLAFWLWPRQRLLAVLLAIFSFGSLWVFSLPAVALKLQQFHATHAAIDPREAIGFRAGAIVVLGGGRNSAAAEYGGADQPGSLTFARLRYGAYLHRQTGLPLLLSGGRVAGETLSEAEVMRNALHNAMNIRARWIEPHSRTTFENAHYSSQILQQAGIGRIVLVTHALHMPRAASLFEQHGLAVLAAPTAFWTPPRLDTVSMWLPNAEALLLTTRILHEQLGAFWYLLRAEFPQLPLPA